MSQELPKAAVAPPRGLVREPGAGSPGLALLLAAFAGTVALIWGFETRACDSVVGGAIAAVMRASFLALTHLPELALMAEIFAVHLAIGYLAAHRRPFRGRVELLPMVIAPASFLVGLFIGSAGWFERACALRPWG